MKRTVLLSLFLSCCVYLFCSCSDSNPVSEPDEPAKPVTPENPKDDTEEKSEFQKNCDQIVQRVANANRSYKDSDVASALSKLTASGAFSDIDYSDQGYTTWTPQAHLDRLLQMASAYTATGSSYYQKSELYTQIINALTYWNQRKPKSDNWWHNQIAYPRSMGYILSVMRAGKEKVSATLESKIFSHLRSVGGDPASQTGANKADVGMCWLFRGCLSYNESEVKKAVSEVFAPLVYTTGEGVQYDDSYFQHGTQLYIGGYAPELVKRVTEVATYTQGTTHGMSADQVNVLSSFLRNTFFNCVRGNQLFFNVVGRSVSRRNALSAAGMATVAERMKTIDPAHTADYSDIIGKLKGTSTYDNVPSALTHYYVGDFTLYRSKDYSFGVRMVSNRTCRCEQGNDENIKGYFLADGSTAITCSGNEYKNIFPLWDWYKIPGVTAPDMISHAPIWGTWGVRGYSDFVGGLTNGTVGLSVYKMDDWDVKAGVNTTAHKSWFFFGDAILCLGSGIHSTNSGKVNTGVEQSILNGTITYSQSGNSSTAGVGAKVDDAPLDWVWHNNIGYFFPEQQQVSLLTAQKSGSWKDINLSQSATETMETFTLWLSHGVQPGSASYSYLIVPNISSGAMESYNVKNIEVVANTEKVQAVRNSSLQLAQVVFYEKGEVSIGDMKVGVDNRCLLMLKASGDTLEAWVSDPSQQLKQVTITVTRGSKSATYTEQSLGNDGYHKGKSHAFTLTLK